MKITKYGQSSEIIFSSLENKEFFEYIAYIVSYIVTVLRLILAGKEYGSRER